MENEKNTKDNETRTKDVAKDVVKTKILLFITGVLVGVTISTGAFFAYIKIAGVSSNNGPSMQMPGGPGTPPEMPNGSGTPPEKPSNSGAQGSDAQNGASDTGASSSNNGGNNQ